MDVNIKHPLLEFLPNAVENIRKIYNLDNGRIVQSVDILEDWIKKQNHFCNKKFERRYLDLKIIACKGSVEKVKKQIDKLCTLRTLLPKFFTSGVKDIYESIEDVSHLFVLPKMTKDYQRVFVAKIDDKQIQPSQCQDYYRLVLVLSEYLLAHDYMDGFVIIQDLRDVNLMDLLSKINIMELHQLMTIITEGFGARLMGIYVISQSKIVDMFVKTLKIVVSQKIGERIYVYSEIEDLHQVFEKRILPVDFGGEERSVKELKDDWKKLLTSEEHEKYLEVTKASCTDETLRRTEKFDEHYIGLPGSFRTLTVD